jgi:hypothetical protein
VRRRSVDDVTHESRSTKPPAVEILVARIARDKTVLHVVWLSYVARCYSSDAHYVGYGFVSLPRSLAPCSPSLYSLYARRGGGRHSRLNKTKTGPWGLCINSRVMISKILPQPRTSGTRWYSYTIAASPG